KPRKVARSGSTAGRASAPGATPPEGGEAPPSGEDAGRRKWDVRAERPEGGRPPPSRPRRPNARFAADLESTTRRPGASGGRAMPDMPVRGPVDKASPDFVDRWLSRPARKPDERPERPRDRERGRDRRPDDRRGPPSGGGDKRPAQAARADKPRMPAPAPAPAPKLPTLHETILVGLPRVAAQRKEAENTKPKTAREALAAKAATSAKPAKAEPAKGEVVLDPKWVGANADDAVSILKGAGPAAEALVDAWLNANNVAAIAVTGQSEELSGAGRKASRRALGVLKARGVALPERKAETAAARPGEEEVTEATFSSADGRGTTSITIARRKGGERAHIAEVIMREGVGVVNAVSGWMSRSQIKEAHQRIADSTGVPPAVIPPEWARYKIAQAKAENAKSGALVPLGLERCKDLLEPMPEGAPKHPLADLEAEAGEATEASAALHAEPEIRTWMPEGRALDEMIRKVGEKLSAQDTEDAKKVDDVLKEEIKLATDRYFTPEQRALVASRLRDAAISIRQRAGDERAKEVLRAAKTIEAAGLITSPPSDIEFLRVFFQKGLSLLAQQQGGQLRVPVAADR
ncbi:MAG: hypothetical protein HOV80_07280, partial [Polyangiaceae bacterium]|nr:hypothetical protein [Polyangiaceae bacterium]